MSSLDNLMQRCGTFKTLERRSNDEDFKELVFFNKDLGQWAAILEETFGPACKPAGKEPTKDDKNMTKNFGGVHSGQTLYKGKDGDQIIIAMLWPWGDKQHTTLKMAIFK